MFKVVIVFLLIMLVIAMTASAITRFLRGDSPRPVSRPLDKSQIRARCGHCGRPVLGTTPCACGKG